ncbi:MAG: ion transporter [Hyphomicrobiales bacterium]
MTWRKKLYDILERTDRSDPVGKFVDIFLIALIAINVISVIFETIGWVYERYGFWFAVLEYFSVAVFTIEYLARVICCVEEKPSSPHGKQRLRYMTSPIALIDLLAIAPFYLAFFFAIDLRFLRVLRLLRIFKLTRYSSAMTMLLDVFRQEASAFFAGFFILIVLLIITASGAYLVEQTAQPDKFGSIPDAMWWAMATLTTVGYGDVTPVTIVGKLFGACVTVIGIGMAALPAGILASGLADQLRRKREMLSEKYRHALEDGTIDLEERQELERLRKELGLSKSLAHEVLDSMHRERSRPRHSCPHCGESLETGGQHDHHAHAAGV